MLRLEVERQRAGMSRAAAARRAQLQPTLYGWIETQRYVPYDRELERIAFAVGWEGDPGVLLEEADDA